MNLTGRQWIAVIVIDIIILFELTLSMYLASRFGELTSTFLSIFVPSALITLLVGRKIVKSIGKASVSRQR
ncbi:MAG: hypothetical protein JRI45_10335 [Deltaproteobacteria bacterium]|nr:hypothetical protein [Deltaproteobacteria bacterium]MBW2067651.1 hypothetical protein [Deltaproteobacteria bacterium]